MKFTYYKRQFSIICLLLTFFLPSTESAAKKKETTAKSDPPAVTVSEISQDVVNFLEIGDLYQAVLLLREKPSSPKSSYLLNAATNILLSENHKTKPSRSEWHQYYENLAVAYHNLFLFLKARDRNQPAFFNEALNLYKKSKKNATSMHKQEIDILMAALYVSGGEYKKGEDIMKKFEKSQWGEHFPMQECIATYYAAQADVDQTITALKKAYTEKPGAVLTWLAVTDDFYLIRDDPRFVSLLNDWHLKQAEKNLILSLPKSELPKLVFADQQVQFKNPVAVKKNTSKGKGKKKSSLKTAKKTVSKKTGPRHQTRR
jgi:hypothetical protein